MKRANMSIIWKNTCIILLFLWGAGADGAVLDLITPPSFDGYNESPEIENQCAFDGDEVMVVDLTRLSSLALCLNPDTRIAWAQILKQRANLAQSRSPYLPKVDASGYYGRLSKDVNYDQVDVQQWTHAATQNIQANLNWLLYDFGARSSGLTAAHEALDAAMEGKASTVQTVLFETAKRFHELEAQTLILRAYREQETAATSSATIADAQYAAGVGQLSNKLLLNNSKSRAILNRMEAEAAVADARAALLSYAGLSPLSLVVVATPDLGEVLPDASDMRRVDEIIDQSIEANPRIAAAKALLAAAKHSSDAALEEGLPTMNLVLGSSRSDALPTDTIAQRTTTFSAVVQLRIPIFDGFLQRSKVQAARADQFIRQAELDKVERDVILDARQAYTDLLSGNERIKVARKLLSNAMRASEVARGRLKSGVGDAFEVVRSQDDLTNATLELIGSVKLVENSRIQLSQALGELR